LKDFNLSCDITKIFGFYMPKGTDSAIVEKWTAALEKAVNSDAYKAVCDSYAVVPTFYGGQDALTLHNDQYALINKYKDLMIKK
jgi:tripartite-type tricarboxylate transporter receptor subunit TctC